MALKLATGAGKTMAMAMLIAWQTINAVRRRRSSRFARGFLIVTPGLTIKDRLRVLKPNDPDSYYRSRELVPGDLLPDLDRAKIVITNYHAFRRRERVEIARGGRPLLQGRSEKFHRALFEAFRDSRNQWLTMDSRVPTRVFQRLPRAEVPRSTPGNPRARC